MTAVGRSLDDGDETWHVDLAAYDIDVARHDDGLAATVSDLPGSPAVVGRTRVELEASLRQTIEAFLDAHWEAPAHYVRKA